MFYAFCCLMFFLLLQDAIQNMLQFSLANCIEPILQCVSFLLRDAL